MIELLGLGELLIDFTPSGVNEQGMALYARNPGGSIPNMLAMYAKLDGKAAFIGKVGPDTFGDFLIEQLQSTGVDTGHILRDKKVLTTLAIVSLLSNGDRAFHFYRKPGADIRLEKDELPLPFILKARRFHFAGVSLTDEPSRGATLYAAEKVKQKDIFISFDCNYRDSLWESETKARQVLYGALPLADLVKVSEEELTLLTGETDLGRGASQILALGPKAVLVSQGEAGSNVFTDSLHEFRPAYRVNVVDTTGSGDAFLGAILHELYVLNKPLKDITAQEWGDLLAFGNAAGGLTATKRGGIPALPKRGEIEALLNKGS